MYRHIGIYRIPLSSALHICILSDVLWTGKRAVKLSQKASDSETAAKEPRLVSEKQSASQSGGAVNKPKEPFINGTFSRLQKAELYSRALACSKQRVLAGQGQSAGQYLRAAAAPRTGSARGCPAGTVAGTDAGHHEEKRLGARTRSWEPTPAGSLVTVRALLP
jgi:hypothetical protein